MHVLQLYKKNYIFTETQECSELYGVLKLCVLRAQFKAPFLHLLLLHTGSLPHFPNAVTTEKNTNLTGAPI